MQAHVSYKVATRTTLSQYKSREMEVIRRFRDFAWLHQQLQDQNRGASGCCEPADVPNSP